LKNFLFIILLSFSGNINAQSRYGASVNLQGFLSIFEDGQSSILEALPPQDFKVGKTGVAYINNIGIFKVYRAGVNNKINDLYTEAFGVTDNYIFYKTRNSLNIIDGNEETKLSNFVGDYAVGDSIVLFFDKIKNVLQAYNNGKIHDLENNLSVETFTDFKVSDNIIAYQNFMSQFKIFYNSQMEVLETQPVKDYQIGRNTVAYIDVNGQFKIWHKGVITIVDAFAPKSFQVGDDLVAFVGNDGYFKIFYNGEINTIGFFNRKYKVSDFIVAYEDGNSYFKVFDKGETHAVDNYYPMGMISQYNSLAYIDRSNTLRLYQNGTVKNVTNLPSNLDDVTLNYDVLGYKIGNNMFRFYYNGTEH
jgi:hypothetical protein